MLLIRGAGIMLCVVGYVLFVNLSELAMGLLAGIIGVCLMSVGEKPMDKSDDRFVEANKILQQKRWK